MFVDLIKVTIKLNFKHVIIKLFFICVVSSPLNLESVWMKRHSQINSFDGHADEGDAGALPAALCSVFTFVIPDSVRSQLQPSLDEISLDSRVVAEDLSFLNDYFLFGCSADDDG
jgi:hypothetical protein